MYAFDYHRPTSLVDVASLLAGTQDAKIVAGGHTLLPTMKQRLASPAALIDLGGVPDLVGIARTPDALVIGAMTTHAMVAESVEVAGAIPALAEMAQIIGDPAVRHRGTLGGSVANNDPAADYPAALLALGATVRTNTRAIPAEDYFRGLFETALEEGEIVTAVSFPIPRRAAYQKFRNPASRYAIVGVFVAERADGVRVAVTGAGGDGVFRWTEAEEALSRDFAAGSLAGMAPSADGLNGDIHAAPPYRAHLIGVMARRAVEAAARR